jgi:hypothetical protein
MCGPLVLILLLAQSYHLCSHVQGESLQKLPSLIKIIKSHLQESCHFEFWGPSVKAPLFGAGLLIFNYLCNGPLDHGTTSHTGSIHFLEVVVRIAEVPDLHLLPNFITALQKGNTNKTVTCANNTMSVVLNLASAHHHFI